MVRSNALEGVGRRDRSREDRAEGMRPGGYCWREKEKPHPVSRLGFGKKYDRIRLCRVWAGATNPALKTWVQVLVDGARIPGGNLSSMKHLASDPGVWVESRIDLRFWFLPGKDPKTDAIHCTSRPPGDRVPKGRLSVRPLFWRTISNTADRCTATQYRSNPCQTNRNR